MSRKLVRSDPMLLRNSLADPDHLTPYFQAIPPSPEASKNAKNPIYHYHLARAGAGGDVQRHKSFSGSRSEQTFPGNEVVVKSLRSQIAKKFVG